jgi:chromosome segregation ATPase
VTQGNNSYKQSFLQKRIQQRDILRKLDDERYWSTHPDEYAVYSENLKKLSDINASINAVDAEIQSINAKQQEYISHKAVLEGKIEETRKRIEKLNGKIFGKKKAAEEVQVLQQALVALEIDISAVSDKMLLVQDEISQKEQIKRQLQQEGDTVNNANISLRNK